MRVDLDDDTMVVHGVDTRKGKNMKNTVSSLGRFGKSLLAGLIALVAVVAVTQVAGPANATLSWTWTDYGSQLTVDDPQSGNIAEPRGAAIGGGKIVLVGSEVDQFGSLIQGKNNIWVSNIDPVSFTALKIGSASDTMFQSVAYGNGVFLAAGTATNMQTPVVYSSPDGITWTDRTSAIDFNNFGWMAYGDIITFDGSEFMLMGINTDPNLPTATTAFVTTSNGQTWSPKKGPLRADPYYVPGQLLRTPSAPQAGDTFAKNGSTIVFGGGTYGPGSSLLVTQDNGSTWKFGYDGDSTDADGATEYFTVDGVPTSGSTPTPAPIYQYVAYANGKFVGFALDLSTYQVSDAATSSNGLDWVTHAGVFGQTSVFPRKLDTIGSEFVFTTLSGVFTSSNGQTWTQIPDADLGVGAQQYASLFAIDHKDGLTVMAGGLKDLNSIAVASKVLISMASPPTTTTVPTTTLPAPAATPTLVNSGNQSALTAQPGAATAIVNGQAVTPTIETPANLPAAAVDPEDRTPAQVQSLQSAADSLVNDLDQAAGGDSGLAVVDTPTGANLTGLLSVPVPIENTVLVEAANKSTLFAALNQDGSVTEVQPGAVIEVLGNGQVGVLASGLTPGETVEFVVMSTPTLLGSYTVSANGTIKTQAALPSGIGLGNHTLVVASPTVQASLGLKVTAGALPATGARESRGPLSIALWLFAVGAFVAVLRRRRLNIVH
jgi:hypothetical protein